MSLFRKAGEKFQETKQAFIGTEIEYVCRSCQEGVSEKSEYCPHCGEETVEPVE